MIRLVSIEDDPNEERELESAVSAYFSSLGEEHALVWLRSAEEFVGTAIGADLIFMDIDLPGIDGMDAAAMLRGYDTETPLVFVTNLASYAVRGYEVDAVDFIVKPLSYYNFSMRMDRIMRFARRKAAHAIAIPTKSGMQVIGSSDLAYLEVSKHNLAYHLASEPDPLVIRGTLGDAISELPQDLFVQISKSHVVNMAYIRSISGDELRLTTGETLYFSRGRRKSAFPIITRYMGGSI